MAFPLDVGDGDHRVALLNGRTESGHRQFGESAGTPCRRATSPASLSPIPPPAHRPQATEVATRPSALRHSASASRKALPGA